MCQLHPPRLRAWTGANRLEKEVKGVAQCQNCIVQQNLILLETAHDVNHDVRLQLIQDDAVVVEDDVARLLGRLVNQALLKGLLRLEVRIRVRRRGCAA